MSTFFSPVVAAPSVLMSDAAVVRPHCKVSRMARGGGTGSDASSSASCSSATSGCSYFSVSSSVSAASGHSGSVGGACRSCRGPATPGTTACAVEVTVSLAGACRVLCADVVCTDTVAEVVLAACSVAERNGFHVDARACVAVKDGRLLHGRSTLPEVGAVQWVAGRGPHAALDVLQRSVRSCEPNSTRSQGCSACGASAAAPASYTVSCASWTSIAGTDAGIARDLTVTVKDGDALRWTSKAGCVLREEPSAASLPPGVRVVGGCIVLESGAPTGAVLMRRADGSERVFRVSP